MVSLTWSPTWVRIRPAKRTARLPFKDSFRPSETDLGVSYPPEPTPSQALSISMDAIRSVLPVLAAESWARRSFVGMVVREGPSSR